MLKKKYWGDKKICIYIYIYILYILEVGGVSQFVKPPTGKSFRFVRACERARRGEAVWASERRFDCEARAVVRQTAVLASPAKPCPAGCPRKILF